jgi:hypothetical protein
MKNKLFLPIIIVAVVIIGESIVLLSDNQKINSEVENNSIKEEIVPTSEVKEENVIG